MINTNNSIVYGEIGQDVTLTCDTADGSGTLTWYFNNEPFSPESPDVQGILTLSSLKDGSWYTCAFGHRGDLLASILCVEPFEHRGDLLAFVLSVEPFGHRGDLLAFVLCVEPFGHESHLSLSLSLSRAIIICSPKLFL